MTPPPSGKAPVKEHVAVIMSVAPSEHPPNPHHFWKDKNLVQTPRRKTIKLKFVEEKTPLPVPKVPAKSWVDRIKKKDDDEDSGSASEEEDSGTSDDDDD